MFRITIAAMLAVSAFAPVSVAAPPPGTYDRQRKDATEVLVIEVKSIKTAPAQEKGVTEVTVTATVLAVEGTKTDVKKGAMITLAYTIRGEGAEPAAGPTPPRVLKEGEVVPAFLNGGKDGKVYGLAAAGESFTMRPEAVQK